MPAIMTNIPEAGVSSQSSRSGCWSARQRGTQPAFVVVRSSSSSITAPFVLKDPQRLLTGFVVPVCLLLAAFPAFCRASSAVTLDDVTQRIIADQIAADAEYDVGMSPGALSRMDRQEAHHQHGSKAQDSENRLFDISHGSSDDIMQHMVATNDVDRFVMEEEPSALYNEEVPSGLSTSSVTTSASTSSPAEMLHICPRGASCGQLQANARGINVVKYCSCRKSHYAKMLGMPGKANDCPLTWDAEDGKSITQGSNQFKFCEPVPEVKKSYCASNEVAYVVTTAFPHDEAERIEQNFRHYCTCPPGTKFDLKRYHTQQSQLADVDVAEYICIPLPPCSSEDTCKTVTQTPDSFLVENNCKCPMKTRCPTNGRPRQEMEMGKGVVKLIPCQ